MKKLILLLTFSFLLIGKGFAISPKKIIGKWNCTIVYPNFNIKTIDKIEYLDDHSTFGIGYIFVGKDFVYETFHKGKWKLNKNMLHEVESKYSMASMHPDFTMKKLKSDKRYAEEESKIYNVLLDGFNNTKSIDFKINKIQKDEFHFEQLLGNNNYQGHCQRDK